jgi:hypothetical protein
MDKVEGLNKFFACLCTITLLLMASQSLVMGSPTLPPNKDEEIQMLFARQAEDPVRIVQASFGADNVLLDARLENKGKLKIQLYRLAWAVVKKEDVRLVRGEMLPVPQGVDTSAMFDVPTQGIPGKGDLSRHPTGIVFYVAELQFQDGSHWEADPKKIKKEVSGMVK